MPRDVAQRLNAEFAKVLRSEAMKTWAAGEGMEIVGGPPEQFLNRIRSDVDKWKKVVKEANIKVSG
jgi:tripartite-type tricarboxylate transporter receptor subunit TctC